jgi:hypothetical protein
VLNLLIYIALAVYFLLTGLFAVTSFKIEFGPSLIGFAALFVGIVCTIRCFRGVGGPPLAVLLLAILLPGDVLAAEPRHRDALRAENAALRQQVENLTRELADLRAPGKARLFLSPVDDVSVYGEARWTLQPTPTGAVLELVPRVWLSNPASAERLYRKSQRLRP